MSLLLDIVRKKKNEIKNIFYEKLDVFSRNTYYGGGGGFNKIGTFINEDLYDKIPHTIDSKKNQIIISNLNGKKILRFYVGGKLHIATHVSPGLPNKRTPIHHKKGDFLPDKLHISLSYPKKAKSGEKGGAIMPYAVHVTGAIWIHGSDSRVDGKPASHGCIRIPLFYAKELFELVVKLGKDNVIIDTRNIYK